MNDNAINPNMAKKLKEAREDFEIRNNVPDGYIEVRLSTRGLVGAPEVFWARNFSPEDLMNLGLAAREDLPIRLVKILDSLIYNPDQNNIISVKNFHEKEVIEFLLLIYETFYTSIFPDQRWIPTEEDWEHLKKLYGGENSDEFRQRERALNSGAWKPTFDLDISKDITFYEIPDDFKTRVKVERMYGDKNFSVVFGLPKFGDFIVLKSFIDKIYEKEDRRFARIGEIIQFKKDAEERVRNGENVDLRSIPTVPQAEFDAYKEYETQKSLFSVTSAKALYIKEFDGIDVSNYPIEQKLEFARDPRLDYSTFKQVQDLFDKMEFGYKEEITVYDPIMEKVVTRNYTFQLADLLTAIRDTTTSQTTISIV